MLNSILTRFVIAAAIQLALMLFLVKDLAIVPLYCAPPLLVAVAALRNLPEDRLMAPAFIGVTGVIYAAVAMLAVQLSLRAPQFLFLTGAVGAGCFLIVTRLMIMPRLPWRSVWQGGIAGALAFPLFQLRREVGFPSTLDLVLYSLMWAIWMISVGMVIHFNIRHRPDVAEESIVV